MSAPEAPSRSDRRPRPELSRSAWLRIALAVAVAVAAILLFPRTGGDRPPIASLALIGTVIGGAMTAALYWIVRRELALPSRVAAAMAFAFALIAFVKFVLAPAGLYDVNARRALDEVFVTVADPIGATITATLVFGLYSIAYTLLYRLWHRGGRSAIGGKTLLLILVVAALLVGTGLGIVLLVVLNAPLQYLQFVFTSGVAALIGLVLLTAATLIGSAFRELSRRPEAISDAGAILTLFSLGLAFLALYHVLWVVYVLVLGSIWPLRTVVPK